MDIDRVDRLLQFIILTANEEEEKFDRQLGPIHLIKYVYLADLKYAEHNNGETYTGIRWQFYKFGPWSQSVNERIEPALLAIGALKKIFPSDYEDKEEWIRWSADDENKLSLLDQELPLTITATLQKNIHTFCHETSELLSYVYNTLPMLSAAPCEYLDFTLVQKKERHVESNEPECIKLSKKKEKKLKEKKQRLNAKKKEYLLKKRGELVAPPIKPRYDDVYFEGLKWLDSLAGEPISQGEKEATFSESIWKSPSRRGDDEIPD